MMKRIVAAFTVVLIVMGAFVSSAYANEKKPSVLPPVVVAPAVPTMASGTESLPAPVAAVPLAAPDTSGILFMQNLRKIGATIYYLGDALGLHGWFVVKDGQVQILYTTPDQKALMVGALLSAEGANISQQQVMLLANSNPDIEKVLKKSAAVTGQAPPVPANDTKASPEIPASVAVSSPSAAFFDALNKAANVTFGNVGAPQLIMIMDVHCQHCHNAWKSMEPLVEGGKLRVTLVPVTALGPQSEVEAANLLSKKDPYDAWKKHVAGNDKILKTGEQNPDKEAAIYNNTTLIKKWGVDQTPYILYRGKNGKIRLIEGEPKSIADIMSDIQ